jgi:DNA-binding transcriptional MerR regulator
MDKSADAFRTISEAAEELEVPQHVLRFWETRFPQIKPLKRAGGRRYYRPRDIELLRLIKRLLYCEGYTIKGVLRVFNEQGAGALAAVGGVSDKSAALSLPPGQCPQDLANAPPWQDTDAGIGIDPLGDRRAPPILPDPTERALFASTTVSRHKGPPALAADGVMRLQAALVALAECEEILEGARRARTSN